VSPISPTAIKYDPLKEELSTTISATPGALNAQQGHPGRKSKELIVTFQLQTFNTQVQELKN